MLSLILHLAIIHQAMGFTYWIDPASCTGDKSLDDVITDTKSMAESAYRRLNSADDTDFQHIYEFAMKRKKDTSDKVFEGMTGKKTISDISCHPFTLLMRILLNSLHE